MKDPAILFYTGDFLTGTILMSDEQTGKYIKLLCIQHQKGHLSEKDMLNICKTYDEDIFSKFQKDEQGLYYNVRMDNEAIKRKNYAQSRRDNRLNRKEHEEKQEDINIISESYDEHMENINENIDINKVKKVKFDLLTDGEWNRDTSLYNGLNKTHPKIFKLKFPMTYIEHSKLVQKFGTEKVRLIYDAMQNRPDLLKKYESAYLTANTWLNRK